MSSPIATYKSAYHVKYIVNSCRESLDDDLYCMMLDYCAERGYRFTMREFDSWNYIEDRDTITSLPAFSLYIDKLHMTTTYPLTGPTDHFDMFIEKYERSQKDGVWSEALSKGVQALRGLLRPTRPLSSVTPVTPIEATVELDVNPMHS